MATKDSKNSSVPAKSPEVIALTPPGTGSGRLKALGGSRDDEFNNIIANQVCNTLWTAHSDQDERQKQKRAALTGLVGVKPADELEGMIAAQLLATHNAAMECYRRSMLSQQTFEGRREGLN
jgi:hypothetical protein